MSDIATAASSTALPLQDPSLTRTPVRAPQILVVFTIEGQTAAFPIQSVERIVPMARLAQPPGLPSMLEGVLNLAGTAVPVLRIDRLFRMKEQHPELYSMLIIINGIAERPFAVLVDRVDRIAAVTPTDILPIVEQDSFNACAEAAVRLGEQVIHLLSPDRLLLAAEREVLNEFQDTAQRRLLAWDPGQ